VEIGTTQFKALLAGAAAVDWVQAEGVLEAALDQSRSIPTNARALEIALEAMPVAVSWASLEDHSILSTNRMFTQLFGYQACEFRDIGDWIEKTYVFDEDRLLARDTWQPHLSGDGDDHSYVPSIELRVLCKDGSIKTVLNAGVVLPENNWAVATFVDITEQKQTEQRLKQLERQARETESIYRLLLDHSPEMIVLSPTDWRRRYVSSAVQQITGFTAQEYLAFIPPMMLHPDDREQAVQVIRAVREGVASRVLRHRTLHKNGTYRWVEATVTSYKDTASDQGHGYIATVRDISEQKENEDKLADQYRELSEVAALDELTGISNRRTFNQRLRAEAHRRSRTTSDLSLLLLDVDYFKQYNDLYGHMPGDVCLKQIAGALESCVRRVADLPARFGGEEFVVLLPLTKLEGARTMAQNIIDAVAALAIPHAGSCYGLVTISVGVACWPAQLPVDEAQFLAQADAALYQAKNGGRNCFRDNL
jgi:diguanylate cyclase (GGDEF)-like protein/PAS domain S-box-containing protein